MIRAGYKERGEAWAGTWKYPSKWSRAALTSVGDRSIYTSTLTSLNKGKCGHLLCQFCLWLTRIRLAQYGSSKCHLIWPGMLDTLVELSPAAAPSRATVSSLVSSQGTPERDQTLFSVVFPLWLYLLTSLLPWITPILHPPPLFLSVSKTAQWVWHLPLSDSIWIDWPILQKYLLTALWFAQGLFSLPENL